MARTRLPLNWFSTKSDDTPARDLRRRMTTRVLDMVVLLALIGTLASAAVALGWLPSTAGFSGGAFLRVAVPATLLLGILAIAYRRGADWPLRAGTVLLPLILFPAITDEAFRYGIPQIAWLPILMAAALTSVGWTLVVTLVSVLAAAMFHGRTIASSGSNVVPFVTALMILVIVVGGRILQDLLLRSAQSQTARAERLSLYDPLTDLPHRTLLMARIASGIRVSEKKNSKLAVLMVDLDQFKEVNDTLGHPAGDALLVQVARRMRDTVRGSHTVARFGSDEFTIVLSDVSGAEAVQEVADTLLRRMAEPFLLGDERVVISVSIGAALFPADASTPEELLKRADQALYTSKAGGRDRISFFTPTMQDAADTRRRLVAELRGAIALGQLEVHYQPIIELSTGSVHHAEALVRWRHPSLGMVSPAVFIPLAESTGLIHEIGEWVFHEAAVHAKKWRTLQGRAFTVGVNRSPVQFRPHANGGASWPEQLAAIGLPGDGVTVEITEGLLLDDADGVAEQLAALRSAGITVALDDFGTGYSALAYLQKYRFDYLKIDRAFVRDLDEASQNMPLCKAMIMMAHELGMKVVAEGVETAEQQALLARLGCDYAQGFLFARPMPAAEFEAFLDRARAA